MKISKSLMIIILGLVCSTAQSYFWQSWKRPETEEELAKRKVDLKYEEKRAHLEHKKEDVRAHAQQKRDELNYKQSRLDLERKKEHLKVDR